MGQTRLNPSFVSVLSFPLFGGIEEIVEPHCDGGALHAIRAEDAGRGRDLGKFVKTVAAAVIQ